ncbi:hypothetical protein D8674_040622 [Pyrus ussuriensis x Pyrus communis]|uniref:Uncharacterized protein n=1 Tax=Pyrus ussuriensis x Pyrus communis TaxID=2448454 RepID=A0A5N5H581_9ROSA|nr:hypothetical protein D8674_040622 [Pyrus ussuriensis x Pyrus communis]
MSPSQSNKLIIFLSITSLKEVIVLLLENGVLGVEKVPYYISKTSKYVIHLLLIGSESSPLLSSSSSECQLRSASHLA